MLFFPSVTTWHFQQTLLDLAIAAMAIWDTPNIHLYKSPLVPGPADVLADYTAIEADFPGYAAIAGGTWLPAGLNGANQMHTQQPTVQFTANDTINPNTIYGVYVADAADTGLLFAYLFDSPVLMGVNLFEALNATPDYTWGQVTPWTTALSLLTLATAMGGPLNGGKFGLFQGGAVPEAGWTLASLTEADYTGYARKTATTWLAAKVDAAGNPATQTVTQQFTASGVVISNSIGGSFVTDSGGTNLLFAQQLDALVSMGLDTLHAINAGPVVFAGT